MLSQSRKVRARHPVHLPFEDSGESFQFPLRIATTHARLIKSDDELLLLVEMRRTLRAIGH